MRNFHKTQWCIAEYLFQRNKELCSHNKYVHKVCRNFIPNSQKIDPTQLPFNLCVKTVLQPYNEILVNNKNKWNIDTCNNLNESPGNFEGWKKAYLIRLHTVSFHYIIFLRWQIYSNGGDISGSSSWRKCERSEYDYKMDSCADKNVLCPDLSISMSWLR